MTQPNNETKLDKLIRETSPDSRKFVKYRACFNQLVGNLLAAMLLEAIYFKAQSKDKLTFYKFANPCNHKEYRSGDSWCEELDCSYDKFQRALSRIATKVKKGCKKGELQSVIEPEWDEHGRLANASLLVLYWTDKNRKTWYWINERLLFASIEQASLGKSENPNYLSKSENPNYLYSENPITENPKDSKHLSSNDERGLYTDLVSEEHRNLKQAVQTPIDAAPSPSELQRNATLAPNTNLDQQAMKEYMHLSPRLQAMFLCVLSEWNLGYSPVLARKITETLGGAGKAGAWGANKPKHPLENLAHLQAFVQWHKEVVPYKFSDQIPDNEFDPDRVQLPKSPKAIRWAVDVFAEQHPSTAEKQFIGERKGVCYYASGEAIGLILDRRHQGHFYAIYDHHYDSHGESVVLGYSENGDPFYWRLDANYIVEMFEDDTFDKQYQNDQGFDRELEFLSSAAMNMGEGGKGFD